MSFFRRRLSKSDRDRDNNNNNRLSHHSDRNNPMSPTSPPTSYNMATTSHQQGDAHHSRPASSTAMSDASYDFAAHHNPNATISPNAQQNTSHRYANNPSSTNNNSSSSTTRPITHTLPPAVPPHSGSGSGSSGGGIGNLSRTDQVVLRYFWEAKAEENVSRDLHFLKFPAFGHAPTDRELVPFCEIYALVKNSQGAEIVGLGTLSGGAGGGTFIGFELFSSAQLHIDLSDTWTVPISHHRVHFKPFANLFSSSSSNSQQQTNEMAQLASTWPKPLTIEFLEELYANRWARDLNAPCWESREVRELGGASEGGVGDDGAGEMMEDDLSIGGGAQQQQQRRQHQELPAGGMPNGNVLGRANSAGAGGGQRGDVRRHNNSNNEDETVLGQHTVGI